MDEYISKQTFKEKYLCCGWLPEMSEEEFDAFPAADVAPVRHGSWVFDHMTGERAYCANCSECGNRKHFVNQEAAQKEKYCSLCGARMDKEDNRDKHTLDE